jgi:hypothetical protein
MAGIVTGLTQNVSGKTRNEPRINRIGARPGINYQAIRLEALNKR